MYDPNSEVREVQVNSYDRNSFLFGFTPQAEIWNGRFAMIGFVAYLLWDLGGYSVIRDVFGIVTR